MNNLKVALMQLLPEDNLSGNLDKGIEYCKRAKQMGADIALFPEMWSCGYTIPQNNDKLNNLAINSDDEFVLTFKKLAKELDMA